MATWTRAAAGVDRVGRVGLDAQAARRRTAGCDGERATTRRAWRAARRQGSRCRRPDAGDGRRDRLVPHRSLSRSRRHGIGRRRSRSGRAAAAGAFAGAAAGSGRRAAAARRAAARCSRYATGRPAARPPRRPRASQRRGVRGLDVAGGQRGAARPTSAAGVAPSSPIAMISRSPTPGSAGRGAGPHDRLDDGLLRLRLGGGRVRPRRRPRTRRAAGPGASSPAAAAVASSVVALRGHRVRGLEDALGGLEPPGPHRRAGRGREPPLPGQRHGVPVGVARGEPRVERRQVLGRATQLAPQVAEVLAGRVLEQVQQAAPVRRSRCRLGARLGRRAWSAAVSGW